MSKTKMVLRRCFISSFSCHFDLPPGHPGGALRGDDFDEADVRQRCGWAEFQCVMFSGDTFEFMKEDQVIRVCAAPDLVDGFAFGKLCHSESNRTDSNRILQINLNPLFGTRA